MQSTFLRRAIAGHWIQWIWNYSKICIAVFLLGMNLVNQDLYWDLKWAETWFQNTTFFGIILFKYHQKLSEKIGKKKWFFLKTDSITNIWRTLMYIHISTQSHTKYISCTFLSNWNRFKRFHSLCLCNEECLIKSFM